MKRMVYSSFVFFVTVLLFRCTTDIAGGPGSGSETTNAFTLCALYPDGDPAVRATVRLRPVDYLLKSGSYDNSSYIDTVTDEKGFVVFSGIDSGKYIVEVNDRHGYAALIACSVALAGDIAPVSGMMRKTSSLSGRISDGADFTSLIVQVYGLERLAEVDPLTGYFTIEDVPEGVFTLRVSSIKDTGVSVQIRGIMVSSETGAAPLTIDLNWPFRTNLFINTTADGAGVSETVYNFPLAVKLDETNFDFSHTVATYPLISFVDAAGDTLAHEVELWDSIGQNALIWVNMDTLPGDTVVIITMLSDKKNDANSFNHGVVFDTSEGFQAVWHLGDVNTGTVHDATQNSFEGTSYSLHSVTDGILGKCTPFSDSGYIEIPNSAQGKIDFGENGTFTLSAWVKTEELDSLFHDIVSKGNFQYGLQINKYVQYNFYTFRDGSGWNCTDASVIKENWVYVAGIRSGMEQYLYINGTVADTIPLLREDNARFSSVNNIMIGRRSDLPDRYFSGLLDEIRIENRNRGAAWIKLCFENQKPGQKMVYLPRM